jgi:hypothetical protein
VDLAELVRQYQERFEAKFGPSIRSEHRRAMAAILRCRTPDAGELVVRCPDCARMVHVNHSCGHRMCPRCQNHETGTWLDRQREKLLPVPYFLVTFTVPASLRPLARLHRKTFFDALFDASAEALRKMGKDERFLGGDLGMTGVLHTHSRKLDFHPHIHFLVPGGAIDVKNRFWKRKDWKFLFPEKALAKIFRGKLLARFAREGWDLPNGLRDTDWVADCKAAGSGEPALKYLSRYLYRGVIAEKRIVTNQDGKVTFVYRESGTGTWKRRTLPGEDFLRLVLQHVLPRGFRRSRDFGFLHGNARKSLRLIQYLLQAKVPPRIVRPRPAFLCPVCGAEMAIVAVGIRRAAPPTGPP